MLWRRDRQRRRGGGVAIYVKTSLQSTQSLGTLQWWQILWTTLGSSRRYDCWRTLPPAETTIRNECVARLHWGLCEWAESIFSSGGHSARWWFQSADRQFCARADWPQPTRGDNILDRLFVSSPTAYSTVRVVKSTVRSDHKAIVAYNASPTITAKTTVTKSYRRVTPAQHALLLQHNLISIFQALILISSMIHKNRSIYLTSSTTLHISFLTSFIPFAPLPLHLETQIL